MALNDSRFAFDQIFSWSLQTEYNLNKEAREAVKEITNEYKDPVLYRTGGYILVSSDEPEKLSFDKILNEFSDASREEKVNLLEMLWKNLDISKNEKGKFLLKVIKNDVSLKVLTIATKKLIMLYELDLSYLDLRHF